MGSLPPADDGVSPDDRSPVDDAKASVSGGRAHRGSLFFLAFGSGFAVLTIEIAGARLIAPVFGLSAVPWTAVIGVILTALAVGSHFGGRLADAGEVPLSRILVAAGLCGALPVIGSGVPWMAREAFGFIPGAIITAAVLFAPPVACLGAVVPFLVQADTESLGSVGRRAGDLSAAATAGSIMGSFVTGFFLLPAMPLPLLLGLTAAALLGMAGIAARVLGGGVPSSQVVAGILLLPTLGVLGSGLPSDRLHRSQTLYSYVEVTERTWADGRVVRELWQNGGSSSAEEIDSGRPAHVYATASLEMLEPVIDRANGILVLGGAALTLPVAFTDRNPRVQVDVVEIDPVVTRLAADFFAFGREERPNIRVVHDDARVVLRQDGPVYDLVYLDVFDHLLTVPWTMVTEEALRDMAGRLAPEGVFAANVLSPLEGPGSEFLERFQVTLERVFPAVRVYRASPSLPLGATQNLIVIASLTTGALPPVDASTAPVHAAGRPLTDSWAPVEYLQAKVFMQGLRWN